MRPPLNSAAAACASDPLQMHGTAVRCTLLPLSPVPEGVRQCIRCFRFVATNGADLHTWHSTPLPLHAVRGTWVLSIVRHAIDVPLPALRLDCHLDRQSGPPGGGTTENALGHRKPGVLAIHG